MGEPIDADELEIRALEERVHQLHEKWVRTPDKAEHIVAYDCGMLAACMLILDGFLGGDKERDQWKKERDDARSGNRLLWALDKDK